MPRPRLPLIALVALILACTCCATTEAPQTCQLPPQPAPQSLAASIERLRQSTVLLAHQEEDGTGFCSGVLMGDEGSKVILTAAHCVGTLDKPKMLVMSYSAFLRGDDYSDILAYDPAMLMVTDPDHDLALVRSVLYISHPPMRLAAHNPQPGDMLSVVGHTELLAWSWSPAWVSQVRTMANPHDKQVPVLQLFGGMGPGNSGGGCFSADGELVGISSYRLISLPLSFYVDRDTVAAFLKANGIDA